VTPTGPILALALAVTAAEQPGRPEPTPAERFEAANRAYLAGELEGASRGYLELLADGWESPALHVNLGNARYRMGKRGLAVASWARALRLDPGDADARANLDLARAQDVDQVVGAEARPLLVRAVERVPDGAAVGLFALAWLLLWLGLAGRRLAPPRPRRALGALALAAAVLVVPAGALLAGKAAARRIATAVVVAPVAAVREGTEPALRPIFELHEGTEVRVLEVRDGAVRVRLSNGMEGWVGAADVEPV
jgi:tetratricopeptide (TPR) repeat protein